MQIDHSASCAARAGAALGLAALLSACAPSMPPDYGHGHGHDHGPAAAVPHAPQQMVRRGPPPAAVPPAPVARVAPPPVARAQPPAAAVPPKPPAPAPVAQAAPPAPEADRPATMMKVAIGGTAFPIDGTAGTVPPGSRLVVRVYDAAGGDVNVRVAEGAFEVVQGLPAQYKVPTPARALRVMDLPAVAARVEGPRGRVIYRNETAVLLKSGAAGDIPMTRQRAHSASTSVDSRWATPTVE